MAAQTNKVALWVVLGALGAFSVVGLVGGLSENGLGYLPAWGRPPFAMLGTYAAMQLLLLARRLTGRLLPASFDVLDKLLAVSSLLLPAAWLVAFLLFDPGYHWLQGAVAREQPVRQELRYALTGQGSTKSPALLRGDGTVRVGHPQLGFEGWRRAKLPAEFEGFTADRLVGARATCTDGRDRIASGPVVRVYGTSDPLEHRAVVEDRYHSPLPRWLTPLIHCPVESLDLDEQSLPKIDWPELPAER
ncbi:MAG TPA: hypothetical protein VGK67_21475 [Myxococcales bacterium]|jgi:hypothetical protein